MEFTFGNVKMEILTSTDDILIDYIPDDQNAMSIVSRFYTSATSALLLADTWAEIAQFYQVPYYGDYLKSDICQAAHHGVENYPLYMYNDIIRAPIMFYPCSRQLYNRKERNYEVRMGVKNSDYIKEILLHADKESHTVSLGCTEDSDHTWDEGKVITEATCEQNGTISHTCTLCGETSTKEVPATGHLFGEWQVTSDAKGVETRTCSCGKTETRELPANNTVLIAVIGAAVAVAAAVVAIFVLKNKKKQ